jgi:hypothetical protein
MDLILRLLILVTYGWIQKVHRAAFGTLASASNAKAVASPAQARVTPECTEMTLLQKVRVSSLVSCTFEPDVSCFLLTTSLCLSGLGRARVNSG